MYDNNRLMLIKKTKLRRRTSFIEDREKGNYRKILSKFAKPSSGKELVFHNCFSKHTYERELVIAMHDKMMGLMNKHDRNVQSSANLNAVVESKSVEMEFWKKKYYDSMKLIEPLHRKHQELVNIIRGRDVSMKNMTNVNRQKEMEILQESTHLESQIQDLNVELQDARSELLRNQKVERENKNLKMKVKELNLKGKKIEELRDYVRTYKDLSEQFEAKTERLNKELGDLNSKIELGDLERKRQEARWNEEKEELEKFVVQCDSKDKEIKKSKKRIRKLNDELKKSQADTRAFKEKLRKIAEEEKRRRKENDTNESQGQGRDPLKYSNISFNLNTHNRVQVNRNVIQVNNHSSDPRSKRSNNIILKSVFTQTPSLPKPQEVDPRQNTHTNSTRYGRNNRSHGYMNHTAGSRNHIKDKQRTKDLERQVEDLRKQLIVFQRQESLLKSTSPTSKHTNSRKNPLTNHTKTNNFSIYGNQGGVNSMYGGGKQSTGKSKNQFYSVKTAQLGGGSNTPPPAMISRKFVGAFLGKQGRGQRKANSLPQKYLRNKLKDINHRKRGGGRNFYQIGDNF